MINHGYKFALLGIAALALFVPVSSFAQEYDLEARIVVGDNQPPTAPDITWQIKNSARQTASIDFARLANVNHANAFVNAPGTAGAPGTAITDDRDRLFQMDLCVTINHRNIPVDHDNNPGTPNEQLYEGLLIRGNLVGSFSDIRENTDVCIYRGVFKVVVSSYPPLYDRTDPMPYHYTITDRDNAQVRGNLYLELLPTDKETITPKQNRLFTVVANQDTTIPTNQLTNSFNYKLLNTHNFYYHGTGQLNEPNSIRNTFTTDGSTQHPSNVTISIVNNQLVYSHRGAISSDQSDETNLDISHTIKYRNATRSAQLNETREPATASNTIFFKIEPAGTCLSTVDSHLNFGGLSPDSLSAVRNMTLTNIGTLPNTFTIVEGTDWVNTADTTQTIILGNNTKWSLDNTEDFYTEYLHLNATANPITGDPVTVPVPVLTDDAVFMRVLANLENSAFTGAVQQTITVDNTCD